MNTSLLSSSVSGRIPSTGDRILMSAPKFSSFQPQPKLDSNPEDLKEAKEKRKSAKEHKSSKDRGTPHTGSDHKGKSYAASDLVANTTSPWVTDLKGDSLNLQYGTLHSRTIPRYRNSGCKLPHIKVTRTDWLQRDACLVCARSFGK